MSGSDPIERAKADIVQFDKKINSLRNEESRLETQRRQFEHERDRVRAFVEMYGRYAEGCVEQAELKTPPAPTAAAPLEAPKTPTATVPPPRRKAHRKGRGARPKVERKPKTAPTMPDMIREALRDARRDGKPGLDPTGMLEFVRARYWPHARSQDVGPTAWRMWHADGLLKKDGTIYSLPDDAAATSVVPMRRNNA